MVKARLSIFCLAIGVASGACSSGDSAEDPADTDSIDDDSGLSKDGALADSTTGDSAAGDGTARDSIGSDGVTSETIATDSASAGDTGKRDSAIDSTAADAGTDTAKDTATTKDAPADTAPFTYTVETRTITSSGTSRPYTLARPPVSAGAQLVIAFHGDGGTGPGFRSSFALEANATRATVFVYPSAPGGTFGYWDDAGRTKETQFVKDVIAALYTELSIDKTRVFLTGFSGGATLTNAVACRLGPAIVRAVGINSGTLYPVSTTGGKMDFDFDAKGAPTCPLPPAILVWGVNDTGDTSYAYGQNTRDDYVLSTSCSKTTKPATTPCVRYDSCSVEWCAIPGMAHALWSGAAKEVQHYFDGT